MKFLAYFLIFTILPSAAFYGAYALTDRVFRAKLIPLPFEPYGLAIGAGCFLWALSLLLLILGQKKKTKEKAQ